MLLMLTFDDFFFFFALPFLHGELHYISRSHIGPVSFFLFWKTTAHKQSSKKPVCGSPLYTAKIPTQTDTNTVP